ncbi:unnamed protein product [Timema podura]|uniref:Uncharacterized protein n=1 Tax=Timema podura TaxID=61482 RepID=A0ABN7NU59_TIMPD|nr:unnamed protein product [Timema podura]
MKTCDISVLKEEIVELIKTEPQNEDKFDMCGQSGIKTEDYNLAGDFKDTINYEAQHFQTSEVEMKSPWDGFLPIKEQIKDESDTSNSVDEIVKTEHKLYDSSLGIMDSNIDHYNPVYKSEMFGHHGGWVRGGAYIILIPQLVTGIAVRDFLYNVALSTRVSPKVNENTRVNLPVTEGGPPI